MEIRDLHYFIEVANHKNFTKAAASVHLSQTALSKAVKKIETELGVELLDRSMRELKLTDAGQVVYNQALKALSTLDKLPNLLDDLMNLQSGELKLGIPPLIGTLFFPRIAKGFNDLYPNVSLELIEYGAKRIETLVEEDQVDLGIIMLPVNKHEDAFHIYPFIEEQFLLYVHESHPFASRQFVTLEQLKDEKFIMFSEEFTLHHRLIQETLRTGFMPNIAYKTSQWDLIIELIAAKLGIGILPESLSKKVTDPSVTTVPIHDELLRWELAVITRKEKYMSFALRELLAFLTSSMQSEQ